VCIRLELNLDFVIGAITVSVGTTECIIPRVCNIYIAHNLV